MNFMRNFKILKCQFLNNISEFIKKKNINELKNFEKNIFEKKNSLQIIRLEIYTKNSA